jgi:hypothetical protein
MVVMVAMVLHHPYQAQVLPMLVAVVAVLTELQVAQEEQAVAVRVQVQELLVLLEQLTEVAVVEVVVILEYPHMLVLVALEQL